VIGAALVSVSTLLAATAGGISNPVVAVGRSVVLTAPARGRVILLGGSLTLSSRVEGDVIAWGANVDLRPGASVEGNLFAFGGRIRGDTSAVRGRVVAPGSLASLYLAEARRLPWSAGTSVPLSVRLGIRFFVLALWLLAACAVLRVRSSGVARAADSFASNPGVSAIAGLVTVAILFLSGVAAVSALPAIARVPVAGAIFVLAAALKIFGMAALFLFVGRTVQRDCSARRRPAAVAWGLLLAGAVSLVPVAGPILWSAVSVLAIGAAAVTGFGSPRLRVAVS